MLVFIISKKEINTVFLKSEVGGLLFLLCHGFDYSTR